MCCLSPTAATGCASLPASIICSSSNGAILLLSQALFLCWMYWDVFSLDRVFCPRIFINFAKYPRQDVAGISTCRCDCGTGHCQRHQCHNSADHVNSLWSMVPHCVSSAAFACTWFSDMQASHFGALTALRLETADRELLSLMKCFVNLFLYINEGLRVVQV